MNHKISSKLNSQRGFTLIELIIVIFIMGMLSGALIMNFRAGDRQRRVNLSRDTIISAFRTAQNLTLAGKQIPPAAQAPHVRGNTRCINDNAAISYWVEFTASNVIDIMAEDRCGAIMRIQQFSLVPQTRFIVTNPFTLTNSSGSTSSTTIAVRFTPPFGTASATTTSAPLPASFNPFITSSLTIAYTDGQRTRTITMDGISGRID
jgi:prepilin-type N-terminal cleavage/methylation domain-containing protein